ncbi:P-loop containing nucleoside triphosphate hydrolase protein [Hymenopellis radicata]|nr:P-loop containing nucleoside triphosphate hydrolase protein [Hymenopellis radicata]
MSKKSKSKVEDPTDLEGQKQDNSLETKKKKRKHTDEVDAEVNIEKKKRKKKKLTEATTPKEADAEDTQPSSEKKKKRKRDDSGPSAEQAVDESQQAESSTEKKKKKHKRDDASQPAVESTPSERDKKKKKSQSSEATIQSSASDSEVTDFLTKNHITCVPPITPYLSFSALPIPSSLSTPLSRFPAPTPIQACAWPSALAGRDVVGIAETGSGKTLAFGIPALAKLIANPPSKDGITTLVLAPTRELAMQTHDQLVEIGKPFGIGSVAVYGGAPKDSQIRLLQNVDKKKNGITTRIVVGTPGRILDLIGDGACELGGWTIWCWTKRTGCWIKEERQTMMFSATWPEAIRRLASTFQRDPARVTVGSDDLTANSRVEQYLEVFDDERSKDSRLLKHLRAILPGKGKPSDVRVLVFALYKPETSRVADTVHREGYRVCALHGDMKQQARTAALEEFKSGRTNVMVATDVAARGLDIPGVEVVINYTFPLKVEDYVHRIGRTGRGGRSGKAITFFTGTGPYEKGLAGEYAKLLTDGGFESESAKLQAKFPMTIKKKEHSAYGAFFRDDIAPTHRKKIVF